jgi:hypothetical protein
MQHRDPMRAPTVSAGARAGTGAAKPMTNRQAADGEREGDLRRS